MFGVAIILNLEVIVIEIKQNQSIEEHLDKFRPNLKDINNFKKFGMSKIHNSKKLYFFHRKL